MAARGHPFQRSVRTAERDREIALYAIGRPITEVAEHFGVNKSTVSRARQRAIDAAVIPAGQAALAAELLKLDVMEATAWTVLRANHITVSDGRVVRDGQDVVADHKPVLMAIDRLLRVSERRSRLLGLDAPSKAEVRFRDDLTAQIEELALELGAAGGDAGPDRSAADGSPQSAAGPSAS